MVRKMAVRTAPTLPLLPIVTNSRGGRVLMAAISSLLFRLLDRVVVMLKSSRPYNLTYRGCAKFYRKLT